MRIRRGLDAINAIDERLASRGLTRRSLAARLGHSPRYFDRAKGDGSISIFTLFAAARILNLHLTFHTPAGPRPLRAYEEIGQIFERYRRALELSQNALDTRAGYSHGNYRARINGLATPLATIVNYAEALGLELHLEEKK